MERHYFYVPDLKPREKKVILLGEEFHHLDKVLRLKEKDYLFLLNGKGWVFKGRISSKTKKNAKVEILSVDQFSEPELKINLIQSLIPGDKMDFVLRSCGEIGIRKIYPVITANCIVRFKNRSVPESKFFRWQKILIQGIKQSGNPWLPQLFLPKKFNQIMEEFKTKNFPKFILSSQGWELEEKFLRPVKKEVAILIGPEGDFTSEEFNSAVEAGFIPLSLGSLRYRSELAAVISIALFKYSSIFFQSQGEEIFS